MSEIHTPYHFVPLSKWVYMPDWAHLVSHDVPFADGHSGVIDYTLTNISPLCVGDSKDADNLLKFARNPHGKPIVPGSSLKGMLRSVLEIASFGKFSALDDKRYSYRDISNAKTHYLQNVIHPNSVSAGWLKYNNQKEVWEFTKADFCKLHHNDIKKGLGKTIENDWDAVKKYQTCPITMQTSAHISAPKGKQGNRWAEHIGSGSEDGHIVFTNKRIVNLRMGTKENFEFSYFFYNHDNSKPVNVHHMVNDFFANHGEAQVNYMRANQHPEKGIPVFALQKKGSKGIHSLGFARMPRVGYENSTHEMVKEHSKAHLDDAVFDMAELMFGTLREHGLGLKSRVSFTEAVATNISQADLYPSDLLVLNNPKPTFNPTYVEQDHRQNDYKDYNSSSTPLSGHKRYIAKQPAKTTLVSNAKDNMNVAQKIELAKPGAKFSGRIVFHNLKTVELAALLWVLKLSNSSHQLGHGKPMGAGIVEIDANISLLNSNGEAPEITAELFERHMNQAHPATSETSWHESPQLQYLLATGRYQDNTEVDTSYMSIDNKDYQNARKNNAKLEPLHGLKRTEESLSKSEMTSTAFGRGRLAGLFDNNNSWHSEQARLAAQKSINIQAEKENAAKQSRRESLSEHGRRADELEERLVSVHHSDRAEIIRKDLAFFLSNIEPNEQEAARQLYQQARAIEFHKKPKNHAKQQKAQLAELQEKYGFN
ncbi:TIGR03986 family type III CRISPR-associated RAMP protein [Paraferrimonas haliotis]|uniref:TIGR03986 family type III CRISPR-associated RAMP protein n=1 Tax=Paraferrimonas haliotis TaxID=2013866 RepID=UPI000BA9CE6D|nr:TIGR03986 family CRISPR-associated RAMP protein [Paraferrimonas haliotis]